MMNTRRQGGGGWSGEVHGESEEGFDAGGGDEVVVFDADAGAKVGMIGAGFGGEEIAFLEDVVPMGVQVRKFVGLQTDAMAEVMREAGAKLGFEELINGVEEVAAAHAGLGELGDELMTADDGLPGLELGVGGMAIDGESSGAVREIAPIRGAQVEDVELAGGGQAVVPRRAAGGGTGVVVAKQAGEGFARGLHGDGVKFGEELEFGNAGRDDLAGPGVHRFGAADGALHEGQLVGVFASAKLEEVLINRFAGAGESQGKLGGDNGGVEGDSFGTVGFEGVDDVSGQGGGLFLTLRTHPTGLIDSQGIRGGLGLSIGGAQPASAIGEEDERAVLLPEGPVAGEVVDVVGSAADDGIESALGEAVQKAVLPEPAVVGIEHDNNLQKDVRIASRAGLS